MGAGVTKITLGLLAALLLAWPAQADERVVLRTPELVLTRNGATELVAMPGTNYSGLELQNQQARFVIEGQALPAGSKELRSGGIRAIRWRPLADDANGSSRTAVELDFASPPRSSLLNAADGTALRPRTPQVLAGFIFEAAAAGEKRAQPTLGGRQPRGGGKSAEPGEYELPPFPDAHYSDALVTLKVYNADFRDVLFLMSRIGNVSIMLDPYADDEPTGQQRSGRGGGTGGGEGSDPSAPPLFPRDNTGFVTLNFVDVPFDQALDLLLDTAGYVKADIYPRG